MVVFAFLLPIVVWAWGFVLYGIPLQPAISDYYWATSENPPLFDWSIFDQEAPSRVWFVGGLFAIAACLYLYKGFSVKENIALNLVAVLAVGVAIFPTCKPGAHCGDFSLHGFCAIAALVCLSYVVWFRATDTLKHYPANATPKVERFKLIYKVLGALLFFVPAIAFLLTLIIGTESSYLFVLEAVALWLFATYWDVKTLELSKSKLTRRVLTQEITGEDITKATPAAVARVLPGAGDMQTTSQPETRLSWLFPRE